MLGWIVGWLVREYLWQIVTAVVAAVACLAMTVLWAISTIYNPAGGGVYWLAAQSQPGSSLPLPAPVASGGAPITIPIDLPPITVPNGFVTDVQRYQLALAAGWNTSDATVMTAISIAEDGSGNPTALSPANFDGSRDFGLLQINSSHWGECGGQAALADPLTNFRCGHAIWTRQGFCAWSTYGTPSMCYGIQGHTNSYAAYLPCATRIAEGQVCQH